MKAIKNDSMPNTVDRGGARSGGVEIGDHDRVYVREGDVVAGKYRVERLLGAGGVGFVVAAKHVDLGGYFALKFLRKRFLLDKSIVERFTREAKAACRIKSEYVARVYDVGSNDGAPFLVMEHLVGRDLASVLTERGRLGIEEAVDYVMQACAALAVVHAHGVVHRDIKPENLFLVDHEGVGTIKLLDFGISKIAPAGERPLGEWAPEGEALTGTLMFGSPFYMSPEHVRSSATVDARSDVWSLGVVLYELIAGATPFQGESLPDVCAAILEQDLRSVREASPEVPVELADVVGRCLQKDPANRFGSVAELAVALLPFGSPRALAVAEGIGVDSPCGHQRDRWLGRGKRRARAAESTGFDRTACELARAIGPREDSNPRTRSRCRARPSRSKGRPHQSAVFSWSPSAPRRSYRSSRSLISCSPAAADTARERPPRCPRQPCSSSPRRPRKTNTPRRRHFRRRPRRLPPRRQTAFPSQRVRNRRPLRRRGRPRRPILRARNLRPRRAHRRRRESPLLRLRSRPRHLRAPRCF